MDRANKADFLLNEADKRKACIRAKVEYPFRVIKRQFGHVNTPFGGLQKNTQPPLSLLLLFLLFKLSNLWMVQGKPEQIAR